MNLLRKMLWIIVIAIFTGNAEGLTTLDLPNNTPGKLLQKQKQKINDQNDIKCFHIIIPNSEADNEFKKSEHTCSTHKKRKQGCNKCTKIATTEAKKKSGNLYFPENGVQPTTKEAGVYSCANVDSEYVTDWYVKIFGGDCAIEYSKNKDFGGTDASPQFGFEKCSTPITKTKTTTTPPDDREITTLRVQTSPKHIITVEGDDEEFKKAFWKNFRVIASDPAGRVLLYRLLIEIRRIFNKPFRYNFLTDKSSSKVEVKSGAIEDTNDINIACSLESLGERNNCRSIVIKPADSNSFSLSNQYIKFSSSNDIETSILSMENDDIKTEDIKRTADVGLLHEMLHWFHYLRDYDRYNKDRNFDGSYCHLMMCYYGNDKLRELYNDYNELFAWLNIEYKDEEIRTILGTPNYNDKDELNMFPANVFVVNSLDMSQYFELKHLGKYINLSGKFLNGDDLSENAYRMSRHTRGSPVRMRFGHSDNIKSVHVINSNKDDFIVDYCRLHKYRFMLPNLVARHCYKNVTGKDKKWALKKGEAVN